MILFPFPSTSGSTGCIRTNGVAREMKRFRKMSSYIMQDDLLQPRLTVRESMDIAVELKLGHSVDEKDKAAVVSLLRNSEFLVGSTFVRNMLPDAKTAMGSC